MPIFIKRIYLPAETSDGRRVLVDRLWPRGLRKENAALDQWLKDIAPSHTLRQWFDHEVEKWPEFATLYRAELAAQETAHPEIFAELRAWQKTGNLTLLYAAHDEVHNQAAVLKAWLENP